MGDFGFGEFSKGVIQGGLQSLDPRKPQDFLIVNFALRFRPSTLPLDTTPPALNQFNKSARCFSSIRATRFIGSILDVIVRLIHPFKNFSAHVGDRYFQNR